MTGHALAEEDPTACMALGQTKWCDFLKADVASIVVCLANVVEDVLLRSSALGADLLGSGLERRRSDEARGRTVIAGADFVVVCVLLRRSPVLAPVGYCECWRTFEALARLGCRILSLCCTRALAHG
jgi:hypothetical protein